MTNQEWLTLSEYSGKYDVSVSTLRRRIKAKSCEFTFDDGKYFLRNKPLKDHQVRQTKSRPAPEVAPPHKTTPQASRPTWLEEAPQRLGEQNANEDASPVFATANRLLNELKRAYSVILQEKEEQILQLKEEVADLKTLARVLEEDNTRLKESIVQSQSIDQWLTSLDN